MHTPETINPQENERYIRVNQTLELKALNKEDAESVFNLVDGNREYLAKYLPWVESTKTHEDSLKFINESEEKRAEGHTYAFGIFENGELVGHISIMKINQEDFSNEIGYWIGEDSSGKGTVTLATKAVKDFGFRHLDLDLIILRTKPDNIGSNKVAERAGFKLVKTYDDEEYGETYLWQLTKEEHQALS